MAKTGMILFAVAVAVVLFAYAVYVPLPPEEFKQPLRLKVELAGIQLINLVSKFAEAIGYEYPPVSRSMAAYLSSLVPTNVDQSVHSYDTSFNGVNVRIYEPVNKQKKGRGVVYYHGGGFVIGDLDVYHSQVYRIAKELNAVVVSVDYRRAPENVFPAAVEDSETATKFFLQHATDYGVDPSRVAVMGDSAGGNLATVISRRLSLEKFTPMPKLQVLIYPVVQKVNSDLPSYQYNHDGPVVTKELGSYFISWYLFGGTQYRSIIYNNSHVSPEYRDSIKQTMDLSLLPDDRIIMNYKPKKPQKSTARNSIQDKFQNPDLSPLLADEHDLAQLPLTYISTCQYDLLRDEGLFYVAKLKRAGVKVIHDHLTVCYHGWTFSHENSFSEEYTNIIAHVHKNL